MRRIALIRRGDIGAVDGVSRFTFTLARGLKKLGHEIIVLGYTCSGDSIKLFNADVEVRSVRNTTNNKDSQILMNLKWLLQGSKLLVELEVDAVIANGAIPLRFRGPKIAVNHGNAIFEYRRSIMKRLIARAIYSSYDAVVCVSKKVSGEMRSVGIKCTHIIPIPIIVESYRPRPLEEREPIVLHVGTAKRKRPDISVKAVKILREKGYNIKLVIVGRYDPKYDWIEVRTCVSDEELRELYSKSLALILPSEWEGFPYVAIEAQASGTPVVVGPGVPDEALVHGKTGYKVDSFDPQDYATMLENILSDEVLWRKMSIKAREHVKNFDYMSIAKQYIELLRQS